MSKHILHTILYTTCIGGSRTRAYRYTRSGGPTSGGNPVVSKLPRAAQEVPYSQLALDIQHAVVVLTGITLSQVSTAFYILYVYIYSHV